MLLIFGAGGQFGLELGALAEANGKLCRSVSRAEADASNRDAVARIISEARPTLVVNAAAYTAVEGAETEPSEAQRGNVDTALNLANAAREVGAALIHISTDYVFDGHKPGLYLEDDPVAPIGVYGKTKAEGEAAVRYALGRHVILRTSWLYGVYGRNFLKTILQKAEELPELRVVSDQTGSPTGTADLASATLLVAKAIEAGREVFGTYHFSGSGTTSWHGFATAIVAEQAAITGRSVPVQAATTAEYGSAIRRPECLALDSSKFAATFGMRALAWQDRVREVVQRLIGRQDIRSII